MRIAPYGRAGALVELDARGAPPLERARRTHDLARRIRAVLTEAEVVVGAGCVACFGPGASRLGALARELVGGEEAEGPVDRDPAPVEAREHRIPVVYDGPDLDEVARAAGLSTEEVVLAHAGPSYLVELVGFLPGFAYLGPLPERLALPRRPLPRPRVPARSVAIAAGYTGIYPLGSPGGWHLLGRALGDAPFDPARDPPGLFAPGDRVRFERAPAGLPEAGEASAPPSQAGAPSPRPALRVLLAPPGATLQDLGRRGRLGAGIPPSGALDPETLAAANEAVGNLPGEVAIELPLGALEVELEGGSAPVRVSLDGELARSLAPGERLRVPPSASALRYLAVAGGLDVPEVLGARATCVPAAFGGLEGRPLRRGDRLGLADRLDRVARAHRASLARPAAPVSAPTELEIEPGPHVDRFPDGALDALTGLPFTVSRLADRVGARLEGPKLPRQGPGRDLPAPMIRGAVQVTTDGTPIVLGPDHPTTGGYPVLAVLTPAAQAALARRRAGDPLVFRLR